MDIGFIRGPMNLEEVLARTEDSATKVIESRQGYVCYLLIVDRKTRYMWPFPLKSKSVPPDLIKTFLTTHGHPTSPNRRIRTDGEGSLAESQVCRNIISQIGYTMEKTATDSSSQNGLAERPHQTLATMVRCLLYSSSFPVTFWADALVYAAYINNRLYHSGVENIPYTLWTDRKANLKHLRAFGAHVSVRRSGHRPTKTDPHYYNGRFLRFAATTRNIVYFDTTTKRDKTARHCAMDEFYYGTPHAHRPLGAQELLDKVLPTHVPPCDKPPDQLEESSVQALVDTTISNPPLALDTVTDAMEQTLTANAAQLSALDDTDHQNLVEADAPDDEDDTSLPDLIDVYGNNPPMKAPRLHEHDEPSHNTVHSKDDDDEPPLPQILVLPIMEPSAQPLTHLTSPPTPHDVDSHHSINGTAAQLLTDADQDEIIHMDNSFDMYAAPTVITVPINRLPTLGLILSDAPTTNQVFVKNCQEGTAVSKINKWRSTIRNSVVRSVNNKPVRCISDFIEHVSTARRNHDAKVEIRFAKPATRCDEETDILQLHFDQLRHLNQLHVELRQPENELLDAFLNYTRAQLRKREDYQEWRTSKWSQLDKYELQNMFGTPIPRPFAAIVLPFVWTYLMKEDPITYYVYT